MDRGGAAGDRDSDRSSASAAGRADRMVSRGDGGDARLADHRSGRAARAGIAGVRWEPDRRVERVVAKRERSRLGDEPMEWLFLRSAEEWANASANRDRWRDLALYSVDGTTIRVADSVDNRAHFGSH